MGHLQVTFEGSASAFSAKKWSCHYEEEAADNTRLEGEP